MKKIIIALCVALVVFAVGYNAYQSEKRATTGKRKVYAVLPLSGPVANVGKDLKAAMDAWLKVTPQIPFDLIYIDSESQPLKAVTAIQQATLNEQEPIVITALSPISAAVIPVIAKKNGFSFGINTTDAAKLEQNGRFQLVSSGLAADEKTLYPYIAKHFTKLAIIYTNEELGKLSLLQTKEYMQKAGVEVVAEIPLEMNMPDVRIEALKTIKSGADAVVVYGQATLPYANFFKELKNFDNPPVMLAAIQFSIPFVQNILKDLKDDIIFESLDLTNMSDEKHIAFNNEMNLQNQPVYLCSAYAYNVLEVIKYAFDNHLPLTWDAFENLKTFDGLGGKIYFMGKGASEYTSYLSTFKNGRIIPIKESEEK